MAALPAGVPAPNFSLPATDGKRVSLQELLKRGPVVLAFFKISCPVCQYAFPFFERMHQRHRDTNASFVGISQNDLRDTLLFVKEFGVTFPVALDDVRKYEVSNAYRLTNVPTLFYIAPHGEIEISSVGWSKADVEAVNRKLADLRGQSPAALWLPRESIADHRAG